MRGVGVVTALLDKLGTDQRRLVLNRFSGGLFRSTGAYQDLDAVIDASGVRLMGLVPEDPALAAAFLRGKRAQESSPGMKALSRVAGRLEGEAIPLPEL